MSLAAPLLESLAAMPEEFEHAFRLVPRERWHWRPASWEGVPGEAFTALEQCCHLRDIEIDGYALARARQYAQADPAAVIDAFRKARVETVTSLRGLSDSQLDRRGTFAEYGSLTLAGLVHYLASHDQQHLACMQWLLGRMASAK